ncbi:MAG: flagellar protein FlaG [Peptococcaceae bacterium]
MRVERINETAAVKNIRPINNNDRPVWENPEKVPDSDYQTSSWEPKFTAGEMIEAIEEANDKIEIHNKRLEFSIHEKTKEIMVKIIDQETKEVIKEIPPEKILDIVAGLMELAGLLVDERA